MTTSDTTPDQTSRDGALSLIPRAVLFGDPDRINPQLSPDGTLVDADLTVRGGIVASPDGGAVLYTRDGAEGARWPLTGRDRRVVASQDDETADAVVMKL